MPRTFDTPGMADWLPPKDHHPKLFVKLGHRQHMGAFLERGVIRFQRAASRSLRAKPYSSGHRVCLRPQKPHVQPRAHLVQQGEGLVRDGHSCVDGDRLLKFKGAAVANRLSPVGQPPLLLVAPIR